ncbi:MAG TPA: sensor histidine kinase [Geodermatophilus sp.]|nr:sensor histidine kinase [Geodermatophilus sp.]
MAPNPQGHGHTAAVVGSSTELLDAALPFVHAGLVAGDLTVLCSCSPETVDLVRRELGEQVGAVEDDARIALRGTRPPDAFHVTRKLLARAAEAPSGRLRILGQLDFGGTPQEWREAQRYEAAANAVLADASLTAMCLYDTRMLPDEVVESARATHPYLLSGGVPAVNPDFRQPEAFLRALPLAREPMEAGEPAYAVDGAFVLADLRHRLCEVLVAHVRDRDQREDLHLGVSEVAANAFRHGRPPVAARVWVDAQRIVCTISDSGRGYDDPLAGFQPAHGSDLSRGGMGLWLARKLWDHVDLLPGERGFTVRLSATLV